MATATKTLDQLKQVRPVTFEGVRIVYRNFAGAKSTYNKEGDRNFSIVLPSDEVAEAMRADGWNVKTKEPREGYEDDGLFHTLSVKVGYTGRPPRVVLVGSRGQTPLNEETVELADMVNIASVDVIVRPYAYDVNGSIGISAWAQSVFITINEDELELKYADVPQAGDNHAAAERDVKFED